MSSDGFKVNRCTVLADQAASAHGADAISKTDELSDAVRQFQAPQLMFIGAINLLRPDANAEFIRCFRRYV